MSSELPHAAKDGEDNCTYCGVHWTRTGLEECPTRLRQELKALEGKLRATSWARSTWREAAKVAQNEIGVLKKEAESFKTLSEGFAAKAEQGKAALESALCLLVEGPDAIGLREATTQATKVLSEALKEIT